MRWTQECLAPCFGGMVTLEEGSLGRIACPALLLLARNGEREKLLIKASYMWVLPAHE